MEEIEELFILAIVHAQATVLIIGAMLDDGIIGPQLLPFTSKILVKCELHRLAGLHRCFGALSTRIFAELRARIDKHLETCEICSAVLDSTRNVVVLIADDRVFELPAGYSRRLHERIDRELESRGRQVDVVFLTPEQFAELGIGGKVFEEIHFGKRSRSVTLGALDSTRRCEREQFATLCVEPQINANEP